MSSLPLDSDLPDSLKNRKFKSTQRGKFYENLVVAGLGFCALISIGTTIGIIYVLISESFSFFFDKNISLAEYFSPGDWEFGRLKLEDGESDIQIRHSIWPLLSGTLRITFVAMVIAMPLGLISAVYLSEYAPRRVRAILKPILEILAGIPTVVLGYFALRFISPYLLVPLGGFDSFNATSAGIAVGILCIPLISSLAEDSLQAVPKGLREAAFGLGGTRFDVTVKVVIPAAVSGIVSAFLLAFARAVGETMVVALAAGTNPVMTADLRRPSQTMTGYIVETFQSEGVVPDTLPYSSLYAVAFTLFLLTFSITLFGQYIRKRYQESYE